MGFASRQGDRYLFCKDYEWYNITGTQKQALTYLQVPAVTAKRYLLAYYGHLLLDRLRRQNSLLESRRLLINDVIGPRIYQHLISSSSLSVQLERRAARDYAAMLVSQRRTTASSPDGVITQSHLVPLDVSRSRSPELLLLPLRLELMAARRQELFSMQNLC